MRKVGYVEITNHDLAARCARCHKTLVYPRHMHLATWAKVLKAFIRKHKDCSWNFPPS